MARDNAEERYQRENEEYLNTKDERKAAGEFVLPPINDAQNIGFERLKQEFAQAWPKMQDPTIQELVREMSKGNDWEANGQALQSLCPNDF